jgi:hypothetical protein
MADGACQEAQDSAAAVRLASECYARDQLLTIAHDVVLTIMQIIQLFRSA